LRDALNIDDTNSSAVNGRRRRSSETHHRQRRNTFLGISVGSSETVSDILNYETSFIVAFTIGLLWAVLTLVIGSVFGCCRLCNKCGGDLAYDGDDEHANLKRWLLILSLSIALVFVFTGCICAFVTNQRMSDSISEANDEVQHAISDLYAFVDDTVKQVRDITDDKFTFVANTLKNDIRGVAKSLGEPILKEFRPQVQPAVQSVLDMADRIVVTQDALFDVNRTVATLLNYTYILDRELNATRKNLTALRLTCISRTMGSSACDSLPSEDLLKTEADFTKVPNVGEELNKVNDVLDIDPSLKELSRQGNQSFEDIPQTVENKTADVEREIDTQTEEFQSIVQEHVTNVNNSAYRVLNDDLSIDDIRDFVRDGTKKAVEFDKYRYGIGVTFCLMILLVVIFGVLGVTCGVLNYDSKANATERPRASNQSAVCLLITAGMVVVFSFFLLILAAVCFFAGGNVKVLCDPLLDLEFFKKTIDDGNQYDGTVLSRFVLDSTSGGLTVSGALRACEQNQPLWKALKLDQRSNLNLSRELDIEAKVPELTDSFDNLTVNIDEVEILPQDARDNLEEFRDTGVDNIDFDSYTAEIEKNLLLFDINEFVTNLTTAAEELQRVGQVNQH
jgi:prominin 1